MNVDKARCNNLAFGIDGAIGIDGNVANTRNFAIFNGDTARKGGAARAINNEGVRD
jgi:hypothetical protein